jgi:arylsulfatase A-like enzyme
MDIVPTILAAVDIVPYTDLDGVNLSSLWNGDAASTPRLVFAEADWELLERNTNKDDTELMVRNERFKIIYDRLAKSYVLYDLVADPGERIDVKSEHPEVSKHLLSKLETFMSTMRERVKAPELSPKEIERLRSLGYLQ